MFPSGKVVALAGAVVLLGLGVGFCDPEPPSDTTIRGQRIRVNRLARSGVDQEALDQLCDFLHASVAWGLAKQIDRPGLVPLVAIPSSQFWSVGFTWCGWVIAAAACLPAFLATECLSSRSPPL
ncbi:MAG: hypothetical protein NZV14_19400 [Bryobacteraceae bacterium]|nr:hypothetical protein [Bryobacteraceae bacterium]MDW8380332.1 hypothetical protein [Bryobacterales bacterium]